MARIIVRPARFEDINAYLSLQSERWSDGNAADRLLLESRFKTYPDGMFVAEQRGQVVGMTYAMRISEYDYDKSPSWYEITNDGLCDVQDPNGKIIFGVDLSTAKGVGAKAGDKLLMGIARLAVRENVKWCMLGGRMPGYHAYADKMTADEYLAAKDSDGKPLDRQVRFYTSIEGLKVVKALPNYFHDPESLDYGVLLRWRNPLYGAPFRKFLSAIFPALMKLEEAYGHLTKK